MLATTKVPNLKANHNLSPAFFCRVDAVLATTKIPNLNANHNRCSPGAVSSQAVLATMKVPNLKANHNWHNVSKQIGLAVLATTKVPNLKANHNPKFRRNFVHLFSPSLGELTLEASNFLVFAPNDTQVLRHGDALLRGLYHHPFPSSYPANI